MAAKESSSLLVLLGTSSNAPGSSSSSSVNVTSRKIRDIRKHPKLPRYRYEVSKINELYSIVERLGKTKVQTKLKDRIKQRYLLYRRLIPLAFKFSKQTIGPLGKTRLICYCLANIVMRLIPSWQWEARWRLGDLTRQSIENHSLDSRGMIKNLIIEAVCYVLEKVLKEPIERNKARLQYRFRVLVKAHFMLARARIDAVTSQDEKVIGKLRSVNKLLAYDWTDSFLLEHFTKVVSSIIAVANESRLVLKLSSGPTTQIAALGIGTSLIALLREYWWWHGEANIEYACTNPNRWRMSKMEELNSSSGAQDQLLGLQSYYLKEHEKAVKECGDIDERIPDVNDPHFINPWRERMFDLGRQFCDGVLYFIFAAQAVHIQQKSGTLNAGKIMSEFELLRKSMKGLSLGLFDSVRAVKGAVEVLKPIDDFYAIQDIKPVLKVNADVIAYATAKAEANLAVNSGNVMKHENEVPNGYTAQSEGAKASHAEVQTSGMTIQFVSVSYTYPNRKKKALDDVSFRIETGQLCSIVGFSGCGKSTLIALIVRLMDPDEGRIEINGRDICRYSPDDLYRHISMLFQHTVRSDLTVREFIRLGDFASEPDDERIKRAAEASGALEVIERLKDGFDTELGTHHIWSTNVTEEALLRRAQIKDEWKQRAEDEAKTQDVNVKEAKEDEDDDCQKLSDEETRRLLTSFVCISVSPDGLASRTQACSAIPLPLNDEEEDMVLSRGYDNGKLDDLDYDESAKFSGGEWAKIVLAHFFLRRNVDLLIVDEFSAALDAISEAGIFQTFEKRRGQLTTIAITHRLHLAARSDVVIFMKDGKVVEMGSHANLMTRDGEYKKMYMCTVTTNGVNVSTQTEKVTNRLERSEESAMMAARIDSLDSESQASHDKDKKDSDESSSEAPSTPSDDTNMVPIMKNSHKSAITKDLAVNGIETAVMPSVV